MKPKVLNKYKDFSLSAVYIGRPSKWGNPYTIGKDGTREEVISKFSLYLQGNTALQEAVKQELKGKNLLCFCAPKPCHGDILLKLANE